MEFIVEPVGNGRDPSHDGAALLGDEVLGFGVLEKGILAAGEEQSYIPTQRRDPERVPRMQSIGEVDEAAEILAAEYRPDRNRSVQMTPSSLPIFPIASTQ
jgi:hypothetical protein